MSGTLVVAGIAAVTPIYILLYRVESRLTRLECLIDPAGYGEEGEDPTLTSHQG